MYVFKYLNFTVRIFQDLFGRNAREFNILIPVGLSFIIFQSTYYLSDIYRKNISVERNYFRYSAFVAFFPTVLSGPIQKARVLLPQIDEPSDFEFDNGRKGVMLFAWGCFEKIMVANNLKVIVDAVYFNVNERSWAETMVAAICFSLYIYADFSGYSDMARGISLLLEIDVGQNFKNPYLSLSTAEFWRKWYISLNDWLVENLYIPLGGNRKGVFRKYLNIFFVFFISGLWHGASYNYILWGCFNAMLVIIGQILRPIKKAIYSLFQIDENLESVNMIKRMIVFFLITTSWVFFDLGIKEAFVVLEKIMMVQTTSLFDPGLLCISGEYTTTFITVVAATVFVIIQGKRAEADVLFLKIKRQPILFQCALIAMVICICIFATLSSRDLAQTRFMYFDF